MEIRICKCCGSRAIVGVGSLDFNRSCLDRNGMRVFPVSNRLVPYFACQLCSFVFTDAMDDWSAARFKEEIYNEDYEKADPPIPGRANVPMRERPAYAIGQQIAHAFDGSQSVISVLDFGAGGNPGPTGLALLDRGYRVCSYDPYRANASAAPDRSFELIIAIEVFEHCHDLDALTRFMREHLSGEGILWIQTLLHPHPTPERILESWYIAPRNGHISIFTLPALSALFRRAGINVVLTASGLMAFKRLPRFKNQLFVEESRGSAG